MADLASLRKRVKEKLAQPKRQLVKPNPPPRYDEVYAEIVEWVEELSRA